MDRRYRNGSRRPQVKSTGRMSQGRRAWLKTVIGQFVLLRKEEEDVAEIGDTVRIMLPRPGGRPMLLNLTALTKPELDLMREFFTLAFDTADPIVQQRDKVAQDALAQGDDSFVRVYREVPTFVVREGPFTTDHQGVHNGPSGDAGGTGGAGSSTDGAGGGSGAVADSEPEESGTEDDWETPD